MNRLRRSAALCALLLTACSATDQFSPTPASLLTSELTFLRFTADAYQATETSAGFWAVRGQARSLVLRYTDSGREYLVFEVGPNTLVDRDSVYIAVRADEGGQFVFHFSPSGLRFNPDAPAVLRLDHARTSDDLDGDGRVDLVDVVRGLGKGVWKRELPVTPWLRLPSLSLGTTEKADVHDFTSFGMAVD